MSQAANFSNEALANVIRSTPRAFATQTKLLRSMLMEAGIKVTEDRINKAMGRFYRKYSGKVGALTPHKAKMLQVVMAHAAQNVEHSGWARVLDLSDQEVLDIIGQADTERGSIARVEKWLKS